MALYKKDLDKGECDNPECENPDCGEIWLHAACHPGAGVDVQYKDGFLTLVCHQCEAQVVIVGIKDKALEFKSPTVA